MQLAKRLNKLITCKLLGLHDWTCKAYEGVAAPEKIDKASEFFEYAKSYCKLCGVVNPYSQEILDSLKEKEKNQESHS